MTHQLQFDQEYPAVLFYHSSDRINSVYLPHSSGGKINYCLYVFNLLRMKSARQTLTNTKAVMTYRTRYCLAV